MLEKLQRRAQVGKYVDAATIICYKIWPFWENGTKEITFDTKPEHVL